MEYQSGFQVQPGFARRDEWTAFAEEEGIFYEVIELSVLPFFKDSSEIEAIRRWYGRSGRVRSVHGAFIDVNPASGDDRIRSVSRMRCIESCSLAAELGAENVIFHSSCAPFLRGAYLDRWADMCAAFYEELAKRFDLRIWIENSQDVDAGPLKELMRRISHPAIGVCLDLGHVHYSYMPMEAWFDSLGSRIGYLHLSDNNGRFDDHLPLGNGTVDWKKADALWRSLDRAMPITIETGNPENVRQSLSFLKEHGYFGRMEKKDGKTKS